MCNVIDNVIRCVDILVFKGLAVWLFDRAIFSNKT